MTLDKIRKEPKYRGIDIVNPEARERFFAKINATENCWNFIGGIGKNGYGNFWYKNKTILAHRFSFAIFNRICRGDRVIDHICRNRVCVNPDHLREVDYMTNTHENNIGPASRNAKKLVCKKGHPLSGDNLYMATGRRNAPFRGCKKCRSDASKRCHEKRRANERANEH